MTTQYAEEQGFKKKYLAPLIVLMLCAVSLTGAAYAYSTSVTNHGDIDGDYISIDMYKADDTTTSGYAVLTEHLKANESFKVSTTKTVGDKYTAKIDTESGVPTLVYTKYVMVSSDIKDATFTLSGTVKYKAPTLDNDNKGLVIKDVAANADTATDLGAMLTVADKDGKSVTTLKAGEYYAFTITLTIDPTADFGTFSTVDDLNKAVNAYAYDETTQYGFTFTLTAKYIEPTE